MINIDKQKREFESLTEEEIIWYMVDLINKSFNNNSTCNKKSKYVETIYADILENLIKENGEKYE